MNARDTIRELVAEVQALPYHWPGPPDAHAARTDGAGTCASKHALLAEELAGVGIDSLPLLMVGELIPEQFAEDPDLRMARGLPEVHECLTVQTPWAGPVLVDVTWDPPLLAVGLPGTVEWDGASDMAPAIRVHGPGWAVQREGLRAAKEALRTRLYGPDDRELRDQALAVITQRLAAMRAEAIRVPATRTSRPAR